MSEPRVFRAPGRVNLIGEHTDYNDGFVLPVAINFWTYVAATPRLGRTIRVSSAAFPNQQFVFGLDDPAPKPQGGWTDYVQAVAIELDAQFGPLSGADLHIRSDIPIGAGLSSSAALEISAATALVSLSSIAVAPLDLARACQKAESEFVGMRCGIMDQFISRLAVAGHATLLDCRTLEHRAVPLPAGARLLICNSMVKHELAGSAYNERRKDCEDAARYFDVATLRDATPELLRDAAADLPDRVRRRCRHVITEIDRTLRAAAALERGDLQGFGELMYESHASLRDDYEVSCRELDLLAGLARLIPGVFGSRMTGAGFGGCTVNLVAEDSVGQFREAVAEGYFRNTGVEPEIYLCNAVNGAEEVLLDPSIVPAQVS